ncbi:MAG: alpha/beta fold hydrolase [Bradyrhizobium sp.]
MPAATRSGNVVHNTEDRKFDRHDVSFSSCGATLRGNLFLPQGATARLPAIAMAPGMSGVKEGSILKYAEYFARGGFAVLAYDNINFGASDGEPRQEADPQLQRRGYRDAITYLSLRPEVDADRIGIWGTSYSGGHVLEVAAHDRRVKCVVSQIAGASAMKTFVGRWRPEQRLALLALQDRDRVARFRGEPPAMIKAVSDVPGEACVMPGPVAFSYFMEQTKAAPSWRNEVTLRSVDLARSCENGAFLPHISPTPLLMIVALNDELAPSELSIAAFHTANEPKKLVLIPGHHFTPYVDEFALTGNEARDWFTRHLVVGGSVAIN